MTAAARYDYRPHPKQAEAHQVIVDELLYGGAAGGGKSRWARAEAVRLCLLVPGARAILFRRTFPDLARAVVDQLRQEMPRGVAKYHIQDHVWRFRNGSVLELAYLDNEADVYAYQGAEYQLVVFEEVTQFTEKQYRYLLGRLRAAGDVRLRMDQLGWRPRAIATGNPGGPGHLWVKARWVDPAPPGRVHRPLPSFEDPDPGSRCYLPARVADNPSIDLPAYTRQLNAQDPVMRRALLDGDWDILEGVRFTQWRRDVHVRDPEDLIPVDQLWEFPRCVAVDWGWADPFVALWMALLPSGTVVVYRELYKAGLSSDQQVAAIKAAELPEERMSHRPLPLVMDPSMWAATHKSVQQKQLEHGLDAPIPGSAARVYWDGFGPANVIKANNARVVGWGNLDRLLAVNDYPGGIQAPGLIVYSTCRNLIRTLPALQRAKTNPEDVETHPKQDDHCGDAVRYGCMYLAGGGLGLRSSAPTRKHPAPVTAGLRSTSF